MVLGAFAAIGQQNIKRLMAYSSIGHMGFALVGFAAASEAGVASVILYMTLYVVMTLGTFACILSMRQDSGPVERISDLAGLSQTRPFMAFCLAVMMFSLAGIPPMAGFFGKLFVFRAAIDAGLYALSIIGVLASVVGAFYYLRIVKIMYLDAPADEVNEPMPRELSILAGVMTAFTLFFFIYPAPLVELADMAGAVLMQGGLTASELLQDDVAGH
jgi:NADH-quinone oxidoreductase subunit N